MPSDIGSDFGWSSMEPEIGLNDLRGSLPTWDVQ